VSEIQFKLEVYTGVVGVARNRLRKTKILNRLRGIRRQHPALNFQVQRGVHYIIVQFDHAQDYTMFALLWPADCPKWETVDHDIS
jgi:hypothetical protein